jgi:hypothetical protein
MIVCIDTVQSVTLQHQRHDAVATTAFSGLASRHSRGRRIRVPLLVDHVIGRS